MKFMNLGLFVVATFSVVIVGGCSTLDSFLAPAAGKAGEEMAESMFSPPEISQEQAQTLVRDAWQDLMSKGGGLSKFEDKTTIAMGAIRMDNGNVNVPNNMQGDLNSMLRDHVYSQGSYNIKDSGWLEENLGGDKGRLYNSGSSEMLRQKLGSGDEVVQHVLIPTFAATYYKEGKSFKYSMNLVLVNLMADAAGDTIYGSSSLKL